MDPTLVYVVLAFAVFAVVGILLYARTTNAEIAKLVSPDIVHRLLNIADNALKAGLMQAATTESTDDDQYFILGLQLRGWKVTGNPDTGYILEPPNEESTA